MIVADASVVLDLLVNGPPAERIVRRLRRPDEALHAPHLLDAEVAQVLRRWELAGEVSGARAAEAVNDFLALPLTRHAHVPLLPRVWELRHSVSAYDGLYVALAEALDAPLVTRDARLARAHGHRARIELL